MKEPPLSLLSRGYGRVAPAEDGGPSGRVEVFYEAQDYFDRRARLRLSRSGRMLGGAEPAPPKTYSTRRGPLVLFSQDMALSSGQSGASDERRLRLHPLGDLTRVLLSRGEKQLREGGSTNSRHPLLHLSTSRSPQERWSQCHPPENEEEGPSTSQSHPLHPTFLQYRSRLLPSPRPDRTTHIYLPPIPARAATHRPTDFKMSLETGGPDDPQPTKPTKREQLRIVVQTPQVPMSPFTKLKSEKQEENAGMMEDRSQDTSLPPLIGSSEPTWGHEKLSLKTAHVDSSWTNSRPANISFYGGHMVGNHLRNSSQSSRPGGPKHSGCREEAVSEASLSILHLPPIHRGAVVSSGYEDHTCAKTADHAHHLPSVPEEALITGEKGPQRPWTPHTPEVSTERPAATSDTPVAPLPRGTLQRAEASVDAPATAERPKDVGCSKMFLLLSEQQEDETQELKSGFRGSHTKERLKELNRPKEEREVGDLGFRLVGFNYDHVILLEPGEEHPSSLVALPPLVGRKGPGKQSSMAIYRQDPHEPSEGSQSEPSIVRGSLPLELREWREGRALGCLVLGPDGEILQLSLWDSTAADQDHPVLRDVTRDHGLPVNLEVLPSDGDLDEMWTVLLHAETTDPRYLMANSSSFEERIKQAPALAGRENSPWKPEVAPNKAETSHFTPVPPKIVLSHHGRTNRTTATCSKAQTAAKNNLQRASEEQLHGNQVPSHNDVQTAETSLLDLTWTDDTLSTSPEELQLNVLQRKDGNGSIEMPPVLARKPEPQPSGPKPPGSAEVPVRVKTGPQSTAGSPRHSEKSKQGVETERTPRNRGGSTKQEATEHGDGTVQKTGGRWGEKKGGARRREETVRLEERKEKTDRKARNMKGLDHNDDEEIGGDQGTEDTRAPGKEKERRIKGGREQQKQESSSKGMGAAMRNRKKKNRDRAKFVVGKPRPQQEIREIRQETHQLEVAEETTHEEDGELMAGQNEEVEEEEDGEEEWMCPPPDDIAEVEGSSQPQSGRPSSHVLTSPRSSDYNFDHRSASSSRGQSSHRLSSLTEATPPCPTPASLQPSTPSLAALTSERRTPKPVKSETSSVSCHMTSRRSDQQHAEVNKSEDATRQRELRAEKAEHRRQEVERRRREKEEERLRQQEKEEREERVQEELQEERKQRAEQARSEWTTPVQTESH
ncbi:uncharacterized protein LOC114796759 [Denticeps clupeoides]|uniref:uncharacterized protein LOC114796759 n=1 Tax=Denticeps clupeoides TaxID=299321 RepID=UPI0010A57579|nr:uncharacterized protein LOC114796759 [Denticeps clupeoides]